MPDEQTIRTGVRKGIQKLIDRHGSMKAASDKCCVPEAALSRILNDPDEKWGIGVSELIAKALGIRLEQLTTSDFKTHAEDLQTFKRRSGDQRGPKE